MALVLKVEAKGGKGGKEWDDDYENDNITKIHVRGGREGIQFVKFEYVKAGKTTIGPIHGVSGSGFTQTFEINNSENEILISVEGYYNESTGVIQSLEFKTNKKTSGPIGYQEGAKFSVRRNKSKIIGFHGFADKNLKSLGAYVVRAPSTKSEMQGGQTSGTGYDDGGDYDGVQKVFVTTDGTAIRHIKFDYVKGNQVVTREHLGMKIGTTHEFKINHPYEYITSVEGTYSGSIQAYRGYTVLTSLTFKTSKGRTSPTIGSVNGTSFKLESQGNAIVGFHGRAGSCVDSIGAYYSPFLPSPPSERLQGQGGDGGESWDDGAFQNVKKIYVGQGDVGIAVVKFEYENDTSKVVVGSEHGKQTMLGYEEFEIDYPSEYITSVEACYDKVMGAETGVITMLKFKTNKRTSPPFGLESGSSFIFEKDGQKIVGFHGKASNLLHNIGVHVAPIA